MNNKSIEDYGYTEFFKNQTKLYNMKEKDLIVGRVIEVQKSKYKIISEYGEKNAILKGSVFFYEDEDKIYPSVGDFVLVKRNLYGEDVIYKVLERKTKFSRMDPDSETEQVVATNFDYVFIMTSLNHDFNIKRIERYLTIAYESGAIPVIVLTKLDLCNDYETYIERIKDICIDVPIIPISSVTKEGIENLSEYIKPMKTIVFLGSSGVGKSSLVNLMASESIMKVNGIRECDSKGRHTTTHRELIILKNGAMIIDTPGMRVLGMWNAQDGINENFTDIEEVISKCKFSNCHHDSEPGCKVKEALENGNLSIERWNNYLKLQREIEFAKRKENIGNNKSSKNKYNKNELDLALDLLENGYSHCKVTKDTNLNKSIVTREMRKRKNLKTKKTIEKKILYK